MVLGFSHKGLLQKKDTKRPFAWGFIGCYGLLLENAYRWFQGLLADTRAVVTRVGFP